MAWNNKGGEGPAIWTTFEQELRHRLAYGRSCGVARILTSYSSLAMLAKSIRSETAVEG